MNKRLHYLDSLRAILMVLGVVLHAAAAFSVSGYWQVTYVNTSIYLDYLNIAIHTFRMPLFFMVAGFFSLMLIQRYALQQFIVNRLNRLVIPFVVTLLSFNVLQAFIVSNYNAKGTENWFNDFSISHLWFLVNLLIYCLLLVPFSNLLQKLKRINKSELYFWLLAALFPGFCLPVLALGEIGAPIYKNFLLLGVPYYLAYYGAFFCFGCWIFIQTSIVERIEKLCLVWLLLSIGLFMLHYQFTDAQFIGTSSLALKIVDNYLELAKVFALCLFIWSIFAQVAKRQVALLSSVSKASYTIYLTHHFFVILCVALLSLLPIALPAVVAFIFIVVIVYILTYAFHYLVIEKSSILKRLMTGQ